jgi:hypothetical protein
MNIFHNIINILSFIKLISERKEKAEKEFCGQRRRRPQAQEGREEQEGIRT